jgi:hypothetical protein
MLLHKALHQVALVDFGIVEYEHNSALAKR